MAIEETELRNFDMQRDIINPLVSVITVVYNGDSYLEIAIKSVLDQTYNNIEYIIIDGGSTDSSLDIIKSYEKKFREKGLIFKWVSEPDKGVSDAFNKGINLATGDLIGLINSDDWFEPDAVEAIVQVLDGKFSIYCGDMRLYDKSMNFIKTRISRPFLLPLGMYVNHPTVFIKSYVYSNNKFDINLKIAMDYDILLRFRNQGYKIRSVKKVISNMRIGGLSWNMEEMRKEEKLVMNRNLPLALFLTARVKLYFEEIIISLLNLRKKYE